MTKFIRFEDHGELVAILEIGIGEWPFDEKTLRGRIENFQRSGDDVSVEQTALADMMHRKWGCAYATSNCPGDAKRLTYTGVFGVTSWFGWKDGLMNNQVYPTSCPNCGDDLTKRMLLRRSVPLTNIDRQGCLDADGRICSHLRQPPSITVSDGNVYCTACDHIVWSVETKKQLGEAVR